MRKVALTLILMMTTILAHGQRDNILYAASFPGSDVGTKVTNAQNTCNPNRAIPCYIVIDASLVVYAAGQLPAPCTNCYQLDWRAGPPFFGGGSPFNLFIANEIANNTQSMGSLESTVASVANSGYGGHQEPIATQYTLLARMQCPTGGMIGDFMVPMLLQNGPANNPTGEIWGIVVSDNSGVPGTLQSSVNPGDNYNSRIGDLTSTYQTTLPPAGSYAVYSQLSNYMVLSLSPPGSGGVFTCAPGTYFWFGIYMPALPTGANSPVVAFDGNSGLGTGYTSTDGVTWTPTAITGNVTLRGVDYVGVNILTSRGVPLNAQSMTNGVVVRSENNTALNAYSNNNFGVYGGSNEAAGVYGNSVDAAALFGTSIHGSGGEVQQAGQLQFSTSVPGFEILRALNGQGTYHDSGPLFLLVEDSTNFDSTSAPISEIASNESGTSLIYGWDNRVNLAPNTTTVPIFIGSINLPANNTPFFAVAPGQNFATHGTDAFDVMSNGLSATQGIRVNGSVTLTGTTDGASNLGSLIAPFKGTFPGSGTDYVGINATGDLVDSGVAAPSGGSPPLVAYGSCSGTATSSATLSPGLLGSPYPSTCTAAASGIPDSAPLVPRTGIVQKLIMKCAHTGVNSSSGASTVWDCPSGTSGSITSVCSNTGVTVTYGTTAADSTVQDTTHTFTDSPGDSLYLIFTTQASEVLANCAWSFEY